MSVPAPAAVADLGAVTDYLQGPFDQVQGWCRPELWHVLQPLAERMIATGVTGPVAEIGVFHGKFFIGLVKTMGAAAGNHAIDVFDQQQFNKDGAGRGDLTIFENNLRRCGVPASSYEVLQADSTSLTPEAVAQLRRSSGGFSMFSIDGCHTVEHTVNDLRIAMEVTRPGGLIFVDDYYNPFWPGVQEAVARLYLGAPPTWLPLVYSCNKLILCGASHHDIYLEAVAQFVGRAHPSSRMKQVKRFGYPSLTVAPDPADREHVVG